ncbi:MAG: xanthine dehydrogenase accessory protein XdhC [Cucumibacter sp.]
MSLAPADLDAFLARAAAAVLVEVTATRGSTPREAGAFMLVAATESLGTIGGGQLEYMAIDEARQLIARRRIAKSKQRAEMDVPLGPDIGQCCGGRVELTLRLLDPQAAKTLRARLDLEVARLPHVYVFGAGHVGKALALALAPLPFRTFIVETRTAELENLPGGVEARLAAIPEAIVRAAPQDSAFIVLTHDHALDFMIVREALARPDASYVGMIGSKTKRARFARWYRAEGGNPARLARLVCPIGGHDVPDKRPEIIAALTAAELLRHIALEASPAVTLKKSEVAGRA